MEVKSLEEKSNLNWIQNRYQEESILEGGPNFYSEGKTVGGMGDLKSVIRITEYPRPIYTIYIS